MTREQITSALFAAGVRGMPHFGATNFALPATAWLTGAFWSFFKAELWDAAVDTWQVRWECRDFARAYATLAQVCNARTTSAPADCDALAVGEFWYNPQGDRTKGHAINACFTERGLTFIEPQTGNLVNLCPVEIQSCYFCRF